MTKAFIFIMLLVSADAFAACDRPAMPSGKNSGVTKVGVGGEWVRPNKHHAATKERGFYRYVLTRYGDYAGSKERIRHQLYVEVYQTTDNYFFGKEDFLIGCLDFPNFEGENYKYIKSVTFRMSDDKFSTFLDIEMTNEIAKPTIVRSAIELKYSGDYFN